VFDELTNGVVTRTYTYGLQRISENQLIESAWVSSFYEYDGAGSVRQLTNSAGAVTDAYEYDGGWPRSLTTMRVAPAGGPGPSQLGTGEGGQVARSSAPKRNHEP
jgi:hypothetical protein